MEMSNMPVVPQKKARTFVPADINLNDWNSIEPFMKELAARELDSLEALKQWLKDWDELEVAMIENNRWIYVRTTVDTTDEKAKADQLNLFKNIYPQLSVYGNVLSKKFIASPFTEHLDKDLFFTTIRKTRKHIELFRDENIALMSEMNIKQSKYDEITGAQSIQYKGSELTLQQAAVYLRSEDRAERETVFKLMYNRRYEDRDALDNLMTELIQLRHQIALNAGYKNYVDYRFDDLGRFDYTMEDCLEFHRSVEKTVMPLVNNLAEEKRKKLGLDVLKLWDTEAEPAGQKPLQPVKSSEELIEKTIECFNRLDPYFGERLAIMKKMNYLDLESRLHKGPGGYNMTMPEIGVPFIFMNSANTEHDLVTMVHEGGHAVHTFLSHQLDLHAFKEITSEIAEVASMGMELMSMEHWDIFYSNEEDLKRARKNHLQYILTVLCKTCLGDSFQYWMYSNPNHTVEERRNKWAELQQKYTPSNIDYTGCEHYLRTGYHKILHFYVVPFYYIEYAFAQLGALALWRNFKQDSNKAVEDYKKALSLGFTKPIPVFYETAGAKFDFSEKHISGLIAFLEAEVAKL